MWFDSDFSLSKHVQNDCKGCVVKLHDLRHVRQFLTHDVSVLVDNALVSNQLDYCNSFSGASPSSIYANYSASKTVQPELYQTPVDTPVQPLCLRNCIGFLLNSAQCLRQPHLCSSFFTQVFLCILLHIFLPTAVLIVLGAVKVVVISLSFQSSTLLLINLSNSLLIVVLLMLPLCGMLFQMRFVPLPPWPLSESSLKPTCLPVHQSIPTLAWIMPWNPPWCLTLLMSLDTETLSTAFRFCCALESSCMGRLSTIKVQLEIKFYMSPSTLQLLVECN